MQNKADTTLVISQGIRAGHESLTCFLSACLCIKSSKSMAECSYNKTDMGGYRDICTSPPGPQIRKKKWKYLAYLPTLYFFWQKLETKIYFSLAWQKRLSSISMRFSVIICILHVQIGHQRCHELTSMCYKLTDTLFRLVLCRLLELRDGLIPCWAM